MKLNPWRPGALAFKIRPKKGIIMILDDETDPKTKKPKPRLLDNLSVPELRDYIAQLKSEIARAEADIQKKEKHKAAADALFKS
jgi:uncharacterized small protein (DUF1192 family)